MKNFIYLLFCLFVSPHWIYGNNNKIHSYNPIEHIDKTGKMISKEFTFPPMESILPNSAENVVCGGFNVLPLGLGEIRFQQIYPVTEIGISSISQVCFRSLTTSPSGSNNVVVKMGYTSLEPGELTSIFDNNYIGSPTIVYSGELCIPEVNQVDANTFVVCINFDAPFSVTTDDIILEIQASSFVSSEGNGAPVFDTCFDPYGTSPYRVYNIGDKDAISGTEMNSEVIVTKFLSNTSPLTEYYTDFDGDGYSDGTTIMCSSNPGDKYKLLGELSGPEMDCNDDDINLTFIGATCDDGNNITADDFVNENCECVGGYIIPTLSQWGIITLSMIMLIFGVVAVRQRKVIFG